ncbi:hypothetical protein KQH82_09550 [bacterium]|nr:hypothetical protein [bacterium]
MPETGLRFVDRDDLSPICPHCEKYLDEIYVKRRGIAGSDASVHYCPFCLKVLSILPG